MQWQGRAGPGERLGASARCLRAAISPSVVTTACCTRRRKPSHDEGRGRPLGRLHDHRPGTGSMGRSSGREGAALNRPGLRGGSVLGSEDGAWQKPQGGVGRRPRSTPTSCATVPRAWCSVARGGRRRALRRGDQGGQATRHRQRVAAPVGQPGRGRHGPAPRYATTDARRIADLEREVRPTLSFG